MATRSAIAVKKGDGTVQGIYCHWDGYPANNGKILMDNYTYDKALQLMALGNLSYLREELGQQQDFDARYKNPTLEEPNPTWCMFYGRDRGETNQESHTFKTVAEFVDHYGHSGCEYYYFIDTNGDWWVSSWLAPTEFEPCNISVARNEKEMDYA